jgi:DNA-binding MurR/RpiR family transcriptional regulator
VPYRPLVDRLDAYFHTLSPELQRAARWVRDHPAEVGLQSMRQSAQAAGVSPATMTRLAQALGLDGFDAMRRPVRTQLARSAVGRPAPDAAASALALAQTANVASVDSRNDPAALAAAAQRLLRARHVLFLGLRASFGIAHHLQYSCDWLRPCTRLASDPAGAWADQVAALEPPDLLVAVSQAPYAVQTVEVVQEVAARGVPILALTDSPLSPLARVATQSLLFDTASPAFFHSMTGAQALAECLMQAVAEQGGEPVLQRLTRRQQQMQQARAYWDRPAPRRAPATAG